MNEFDSEIISILEEKIKKDKKKNYLKIFSELESKYKPKDLICAYSYVLKTKDDTKLLDFVIREINKKKYLDLLPCLIDFILKQSPNPEFNNVKVLAIKIIANYKNKKALSALLFCLNDKNSNYRIRLASADAIGKIGDSSVFEDLGKIATDEKEKSAYVKESVVTALGMIGDERAIDIFDSIMHTKEIFQEKFSALKEKIIEAMSKLDVNKNKKALEILKTSLLDNSSQIRINTIEVLMNSEIKENYSLIYERLKNDTDIEVKKNALVALYNLSDVSILNEVIEGQDFERELKNYAIEIKEQYED